MKNRLMFTFFLLGYALIGQADFERNQIQNRIAPIGQVNVEKDTPAPDAPAPAETVAQVPRGQKVDEQLCAVCHQQGIAGSPLFRNKEQWQSRLEAKKLEGLTASAIKGINAMPAKGTCADCSEDDIKEAIVYMLPQE